MPWIDVPDAKKQLQKAAAVTVDDDELGGFVEAACAIIEDLKGHVDVVTIADAIVRARTLHDTGWRARRRPHRHLIELVETPVLDVTSVARLNGVGGSAAVVEADPEAGVIGWTLLDTVLYVPERGDYAVTYRAGRDPIPPNYRLAALELVTHLWRGSQLNQSSGRPQPGGDQMMVLPHMASALPFRVRELLGIYGNVVSDHVVIA